MQYSNVPDPLRGLGITFILTGLMAIGFMSFQGINLEPDQAQENVATVESLSEELDLELENQSDYKKIIRKH